MRPTLLAVTTVMALLLLPGSPVGAQETGSIEISMPTITAGPGELVEVPITASGVPSPGISVFNLAVRVDRSGLDVVSVRGGDSPWGGPIVSMVSGGVVRIANVSTRGASGDFTMAVLVLRVAPDASGRLALTFESASAVSVDARPMTVTSRSGAVVVSGVTAPPPTPVRPTPIPPEPTPTPIPPVPPTPTQPPPSTPTPVPEPVPTPTPVPEPVPTPIPVLPPTPTPEAAVEPSGDTGPDSNMRESGVDPSRELSQDVPVPVVTPRDRSPLNEILGTSDVEGAVAGRVAPEVDGRQGPVESASAGSGGNALPGVLLVLVVVAAGVGAVMWIGKLAAIVRGHHG